MKVTLFVQCLVDQFYPEVAVAAVKILRYLGVEVIYDPQQTCCGQPAFNSGYHTEAKQLARRFVKLFSGADHIVSVSGSCAAMVKIFYPKWLDDATLQKDVEHVANHMYEFSDFLVNQLGVVELGAKFPHQVTYHDSCHGLREMGIKQQPRQLLEAVEGLKLIEMENAEDCCGFGGTFSVKFPRLSVSMGNDKIDGIKKTGAEFVVGTDSSCLMHLRGLLDRQNIPIKTIHLAEILAMF